MNIFPKALFLGLIVSFSSLQASGASSLWQKHGSAVLTSLYVIGSAALTYVCYKDTEERVKKLKQNTFFLEQERDRQ